MRYDEFLSKLRETVVEFKKLKGKEPSLKELDAFVEARVLKPRTKGLKSLKGIGI